MASTGLLDQDKLEGALNYCIWKARMKFLLDEYGLNMYVESVVAVLIDVEQLANYNKEMAREKWLILDGVQDHIVSHFVAKNTTKETWDAIASLYQNPSEHQKTFLKEKLRNVHMQKGEGINPFLTKILESQDEITFIGESPPTAKLMRLVLNSVIEEWENFVQVFLGRDQLPGWDQMWTDLTQEDMGRTLVKNSISGSSNKGSNCVKEEENVALALKGKEKYPSQGQGLQGEKKKKRDLI